MDDVTMLNLRIVMMLSDISLHNDNKLQDNDDAIIDAIYKRSRRDPRPANGNTSATGE